MGMNAAERAVSANSVRIRLGILLATVKAPRAFPNPRYVTITTSRTRPSIREPAVAATRKAAAKARRLLVSLPMCEGYARLLRL